MCYVYAVNTRAHPCDIHLIVPVLDPALVNQLESPDALSLSPTCGVSSSQTFSLCGVTCADKHSTSRTWLLCRLHQSGYSWPCRRGAQAWSSAVWLSRGQCDSEQGRAVGLCSHDYQRCRQLRPPRRSSLLLAGVTKELATLADTIRDKVRINGKSAQCVFLFI